MNDIYITLTGNVAAEPRQYTFEDGARVTSLRVLTAHRYFDRKTGQWTDGEKVCFAVRCWRALGDNVAQSIKMGHPVVVSGKLRIREFGPEGDRRFMPEIEASAVGHDLRWGTGVFAKPDRGGGAAMVSKEMRDRLDAEIEDWAMSGRPTNGRRPLPEPAGPAGTFDGASSGGMAGDRAVHAEAAYASAAADGGAADGRAVHAEAAYGSVDGRAADGTAESVTLDGAVRDDGAAVPASASAGGPARQSTRSKRRAAAGGAPVRILGADDSESASEDTEWPAAEPVAA